MEWKGLDCFIKGVSYYQKTDVWFVGMLVPHWTLDYLKNWRMLKMIQKDYDLKGVEFLKILGFLVLSLFIITGCSPNDEKETAETVTEVSTSVAESEIKEFLIDKAIELF